MKQLKSFSVLLFALLSLAVISTSCSNDEDNDKNNNIVGTWVADIYYSDSQVIGEKVTLEFKSNGTGTETNVYYDENGRWDGQEVFNFKWSATDSSLTMISVDGEYEGSTTCPYSISDDGKCLYLNNTFELPFYRQ